LKDLVSRSGVFYESHLERWANGSYPLEELLQEPQGKLSRPAQTQTDRPTAAMQQSAHPDSQTLPVVRQQLETLNSGQFIWRGEAWKDQTMEWSIHRDGKREQAQNSRSWKTSLRLNLPNLGAIAASVSVTGKQIRLSIDASDNNALLTMKNNADKLVKGMVNGGLVLTELELKNEKTP
jgi:hypothetical protein